MRLESAKLLWDASEAAKAVHTFTDGVTKGRFFAELLLRSAVERQLESVGSRGEVHRTAGRRP
ncbi:hypothetical protein GCM10023351_12980 [Microbacterium gilvum]|uniref:Uncharacterized protein n=1 Tax=Microbacterium gilvum TaxID=1336204 RepID=A0ABP8ZZG1_9MICO